MPGAVDMDRRSFLAIGAAAAIRGVRRGAYPAVSDRLERIGLQLYTLRDALAVEFEATIARVAALGYRELEFAGYHGRTAAQLRALLDRHGLTAPSAHVPLEALERDAAPRLADAATLGHRYLCVASIAPERRRTLDDWRRTAAALNRVGERCRAAGVQFAYHNHDFEFVPLDGRVPYDVLLAEADPGLVQLEVDLYWIAKGGHDPLGYAARYPGRIALLHLKDSTGAPDHRMVDVGRGTIDFKRVFAQRAAAGIRHWFVEHDEPSDAFASVRASFEYLSTLEL
jgi:sugar phosphate isomerase/epimerase